ncbi:aldehyde dehydrogenase family protein [Thiomonas sp. FB-Cd]|uniref:aldehyde dehydrogenase family protein n=1 Tax=Thiomonas sp. FB-Cd TaxID=1158292 RepID=UPI0006904592|nr:aldehyde dehydrogenase family protein [Thiomonas sp. FB-Cd]
MRSVSVGDGSSHPAAFRVATDQEVLDAAHAATAAFDPFVHGPLSVRAEPLEAIAAEIQALGAEFINEEQREIGLASARLGGERARSVAQRRMFAPILREPETSPVCLEPVLPQRSPLGEMRRGNIAIGPVSVFGSSNFPRAFSVAGDGTASALAAGRPVVVKARPRHLVTTEFVAGLKPALPTERQTTLLKESIANAYRTGVRVRADSEELRGLASHVEDGRLHSELIAAYAGAFGRGATALQEELFGQAAAVVVVNDEPSLRKDLQNLAGQLSATLFGDLPRVLPLLERLAGGLMFNGVPAGVEVNRATVHGGSRPVTTAVLVTSVGTLAIERYRRPIWHQNLPDRLLPAHMR